MDLTPAEALKKYSREEAREIARRLISTCVLDPDKPCQHWDCQVLDRCKYGIARDAK